MKRLVILGLMVLCFFEIKGQSTIAFTIDTEFSSEELLRTYGGIFDIYPLADGGFAVGGSFISVFTNPESPFGKSLGLLTESGDIHPEWIGGGTTHADEIFDHAGGYIFANTESLSKRTYGMQNWSAITGDAWGDYYRDEGWGNGENPYNVRWTQCLYIMEDQSVLIGGAIATDTTQPGLFRHIVRLLEDGSHDSDFPIVEAMPQGLNTHVSTIVKAGDGSWYVSGRFSGIGGHYSPHIAKLGADFEVDTTFVSPFIYESPCCGFHNQLRLVDSQGRLWFSGITVRLAEYPEDTLQLVRLLPDASLDTNFAMGKIDSREFDFGGNFSPIITGVMEFDNGDFFIHGSFSHFNDTLQPCLSAINDQGHIQANYFGNQGATLNYYSAVDESDLTRPNVHAMEFLDDGSLMVAGGFSEFMGETHYSMVKLSQGTVSNQNMDIPFEKNLIYPNPATDRIYWNEPSPKEIKIYDTLGKLVLQSNGLNNPNSLAVEMLESGFYVVVITVDNANFSQKLIIK